MKEIGGGEEGLQDVVEHVGHVLGDAGVVGLAIDLPPFLVKVGMWRDWAMQSQPRCARQD